MNNRLLFTLAALPLAAQGTAGEKKEAAAPNGDPRPNILFFLVDDMGWQDTSVPFHDEHTLAERLKEMQEKLEKYKLSAK